MRTFAAVALLILGTACPREVPPRDYQNNPPAMTHPVTSSSQSPSAHGMPGAAPEPSKGAEGKNVTRQPTGPNATPKLKDTPPVSPEVGPPPANSQHATQTTSTAVTGTHLATPP